MPKSQFIKFSVPRFRTNKLLDGDYRRNFTDKEIKKIIKEKRLCRECGRDKLLEIDHILPVVFGGKPTDDNMQILCILCHRKKTYIDKLIWFAFKYLKFSVKAFDWEFLVTEEEAKEFYFSHFNRLKMMQDNKILDEKLNFTYDFL